jgi:diguanylate cyclase (GGDEF)-like protein
MLYVAQAVTAGLLTTVFAHYRRIYQRPHLGLWAVAYAMLAGYLVCAGTAQLVAQSIPANSLWRITLSGVSLACAYLHVVLLLSGVFAILRGHAPSARVLVPLLLIAAGIGFASMLVYTWDEGAARERLMARVGIRYAITSAAYLAAAMALVLLKGLRRNLGQRLTLVALAFFGLEQANVFVAFLWQWSTGEVLAGATMLGVFDLVGVTMIGLGLTIWLLEDERERAIAAQSELEHLRQYDALTGLPNRQQLQTALTGLLKPESGHASIALLFIDLDRFQMVNSSAGSLAGDRVLAGMADRLREFEDDTVLTARLEGDEFVLVLEDPDLGEAAARLGRRVCDRIASPIDAGGQRFDLGASIGVAVSPEDGEDAALLMRHAELASVRAQAGWRKSRGILLAGPAPPRRCARASPRATARSDGARRVSGVPAACRGAAHARAGRIRGTGALAAAWREHAQP